ncbi:META domain-containing protein [Acinetobacter proteolyticus]|uniref:META domain-containing protein n=1 Tax=Acinetobacter proteolyticus TaxID=1776741 RepID=A0A2N0WIX2_9GAMM|nr:META domain-containing protein [Acinetobacter proteolyticus]PKF36101.1 META domain-containing protein [Acinetobacter proteolyticus]
MSEQITVKNPIFSLKAFFNKTLILSVGILLAACQSQPTPSQKNTLQPKRVTQPPAMQVRKSTDGVQDVEWQITSIQGKRALFFNQYPSFSLNSVSKMVAGHTGCNQIYGRYKYDFAQGKLDFDVMAQHQSCDKALAQEADLMDAIQRVERFQLEGTNLYLLDAKGQRLIQAQRKR